MKPDRKFGTFGGVFTPSLLTILGVIMYLRLPWVVGEAGLYLAVGIILAAHLISVTTGLSVSSIATDKKVEGGGAYFIISRSMGLSMGGTLGFALFIGLSFSISLYIIGFTESALDYFEITKNLQTIRLWGTVTLIALTTITFISTSLAIKTQYLILVSIAVSLVSIFMGSWGGTPTSPHLMPFEGGNPATVLFGIFFPAVTGFTAGVNMSGDLRDPKRSIPIGTIAAILIGMAVYLVLAIFLAFKVPAEALREPGVLLKLAWSPRAVVAGIWGATLSSALGSILGAPRILQALSIDKVTPRIFSIGAGPTKEPRYALLVAVVIGEAGILIGELDAIARIVSVFFLATYGFLNLSASFEMIASPDFRPEFRIPRWVPVLGVISSSVLMIWLDLAAMLGAVTVMALLFAVLKRRELALETGDAWLGVWLTLIRSGLDRLSRQTGHRRNWVPNLLVFTHLDAAARNPLLDFAYSLIRKRGVVNELSLITRKDDLSATYELATTTAAGNGNDPAPKIRSGFFSHSIDVPPGKLFNIMSAATRFHGVNGLRHNTIMIDWHEHASEPVPFAAYLDLVESLDLNIMCLAYEGLLGFAQYHTVHLWWSPRSGSIEANIAVVRFITESKEWRLADLHFYLIADEASQIDALYKHATEAIEVARVKAVVTVVNNTVDHLSDDEWVQRYSASADLTVVGIPSGHLTADDIQRLEKLGRAIGAVLLVRGSSLFRAAAIGQLPAATDLPQSGTDTLCPDLKQAVLILPTSAILSEEVLRFADAHRHSVLAAADSMLRAGMNLRSGLIEDIHKLVDRCYTQFQVDADWSRSSRGERVFMEGMNSLLGEINELLDAYRKSGSLYQQATAERGITALIDSMAALQSQCPREIPVSCPIEDFKKQDGDSSRLCRLKWRRRIRKRLRPGAPSYRVDPRKLSRYYTEKRTLEIAEAGLVRTSRETVILFNKLRQFFTMLKGSFASMQLQIQKGALDSDSVSKERQQMLDHVESMRTAHIRSSEEQIACFIGEAALIQQNYADDLNHLDEKCQTRRNRRLRRSDRRLAIHLASLPEQWISTEKLILGSVEVAAQIALVQVPLVAGVQRVTQSLRQGMAVGVRSSCVDLNSDLEKLLAQIGRTDLTDIHIPAQREDRSLDVVPLTETLRATLHTAVSRVPETFSLPHERSLDQVVKEPFSELESQAVDLRRRLQILVGSELSSPIAELLQELPGAVRTTNIVMADVIRLVGFTVSEFTLAESSDQVENERMLRSVIERGMERVSAEITRLDTFERSLSGRIGSRLVSVMELLDGFAIRGSVEGFLTQNHRTSHKRKNRLDLAVEQVRTRLARVMVQLSYRESAGLLLARRLQETRHRSDPVDRVRGLLDSLVPGEQVTAELPFYYRQLFLGQSIAHAAFWCGRERELAAIERAVNRFSSGLAGPILVTGEPGSGKSALINVAIARFQPHNSVYRVRPTAGGAPTLEAFTEALRGAFRLPGTCEEMLEAIPNGSVIVLNDLELWWERSDRGLVVIDHLLRLVRAHGNRCLFYLEIGVDLLRFLDHFRPIGNDALVVTECVPVDAETLKQIITIRHASSGLSYMLNGRAEFELSEYAKAKLFTAHFHRSAGNIGACLHGWTASIAAIEDGHLEVRTPLVPDDQPLRSLQPATLGLLVELLLHKQLTPERLARITNEPLEILNSELGRLIVMGLIVQGRNGVIEILPAARHIVGRMLRARRMLP